MYTFISSNCISRADRLNAGLKGTSWIQPDLSAVPVYTIYNKYAYVYLLLNITGTPTNVIVDFNSVKNLYAADVRTLQAFLTALGTTALPTIQSMPNTNVSWANYSDAIRAGYKINICKIGTALDNNLPTSLKTDLVLTRPNFSTDMSMLHDYCLLSVNGYYHRTDTDGIAAYIYNGGSTLFKSNMNTVGILSFSSIGKITKEPIDPLKVFPIDQTTPLRDRILIKITKSLTNATPILILGGYLVLPEPNVWWAVSADTWCLNIMALPIMERYFESSAHLDLTSLGLDTSTVAPKLVSVQQFLSDTVLRQYLQLSQSFICVVPTPNLISYRTSLKSSNIPGLFTAYQEPKSLLITGYGHTTEYWKTFEDPYWSMSVQEATMPDYLLSYKPIAQQLTVTPAILPGSIRPNSIGMLLDIGGHL